MTGILSLNGKNGLIVGIANEKSIAYGCAKVLKSAGANLALTYQSAKAYEYTKPLADSLNAVIFEQLDVTNESQHENLFNLIQQKWQNLDFIIHSVAFAPKNDLHGRVIDSSRDGFLNAMDISCHSFIRLAKSASQLMKNGGSIITFSYIGADKAVENYGIMGPVKAALEATTRYLAMELGEQGIRVNSISPGPILTRAASGIKDFSKLVEQSISLSALKRPITIEDVGNLAAFLVSDLSKSITGQDHYIDAGEEII